jgi:hypothetical protein
MLCCNVDKCLVLLVVADIVEKVKIYDTLAQAFKASTDDRGTYYTRCR